MTAAAESRARSAWALLVVLALAVTACAPRPTVRSYDPWTDPQDQVDVALTQVESVLRMQRYRLRNERLWAGGIALVVGVALEAFLLSGAGDDACFTDPTTENDCIAEVALGVAAAGGMVGSGLTSLILETEGELDLEGYERTEPADEHERRAKLEYGYQLLERPSTEGGSVLHQLGSGLLLGVGLALLTLPSFLADDEETSGFLIAGSVGIGLGTFWAISAAVLREPREYDLSIGPRASAEGGMLSLGVRF